MALAYGAAGGAGLIALKCLMAASAFTVLWRAMRQAGVRRPLAAVLLAVAAFGAMGLLFTIRPQVFSLLLFAALLSLLNGIGRGRYRLFLWMPALFALWANLHGGWIVGLGILALWSLCGLLSGTVDWRWAAGGVFLGLLGTLATPYGPGLWRFLLETVRIGRPGITEWQAVTGDLSLPRIVGRRGAAHSRGVAPAALGVGADGDTVGGTGRVGISRRPAPGVLRSGWRVSFGSVRRRPWPGAASALAQADSRRDRAGGSHMPCGHRRSRCRREARRHVHLAGRARSAAGHGSRRQRRSSSCGRTRARDDCSLTSITVRWPSGICRQSCASRMTGGGKRCIPRAFGMPMTASTRARTTLAMRGS